MSSPPSLELSNARIQSSPSPLFKSSYCLQNKIPEAGKLPADTGSFDKICLLPTAIMDSGLFSFARTPLQVGHNALDIRNVLIAHAVSSPITAFERFENVFPHNQGRRQTAIPLLTSLGPRRETPLAQTDRLAGSAVPRFLGQYRSI